MKIIVSCGRDNGGLELWVGGKTYFSLCLFWYCLKFLITQTLSNKKVTMKINYERKKIRFMSG